MHISNYFKQIEIKTFSFDTSAFSSLKKKQNPVAEIQEINTCKIVKVVV